MSPSFAWKIARFFIPWNQWTPNFTTSSNMHLFCLLVTVKFLENVTWFRYQIWFVQTFRNQYSVVYRNASIKVIWMASKISHVKTPLLSLAYISVAFDTIVYPFVSCQRRRRRKRRTRKRGGGRGGGREEFADISPASLLASSSFCPHPSFFPSCSILLPCRS